MRKRLKIFVAVLVAVITCVSLSATVYASTGFYAYGSEWRGNGYTTGRDNQEFGVSKGETVKFKTYGELLIDPDTEETEISCVSEIRRHVWYGHVTLISIDLIYKDNLSNDSSEMVSYVMAEQEEQAVAEKTGDYYWMAETTGATSAFYNYYRCEITIE